MEIVFLDMYHPKMDDEKIILSRIGLTIRKYRLAQSLSQERLAEKAGLHHTYIGMIERAERTPSILSVWKISVALGIKIDDLFKEDIDEYSRGY